MLNSPIGTGADVFITIFIVLVSFAVGMTAVDYFEKTKKSKKSEEGK